MPLDQDNVRGELVIDPYNYKAKFDLHLSEWLDKVPESDRPLVQRYVNDMLKGQNVAGKRGKRGYHHIASALFRLIRVIEMARKAYKKPVIELTADEIHAIFDDMKTGKIRKADGGRYKSTADYIKVFRAFWHWYMRVERTDRDIVRFLSGTADHKPDFVYFTLESLQKLMNACTKDRYRVMMLFLFDSGIRAPTELKNIKLKDLRWDEQSNKYELHIRDEVSKTFGRKIKLMLCSDTLKNYIEKGKPISEQTRGEHGHFITTWSYQPFRKDDFIFPISPPKVNEFLKRLSERVFGAGLERLKENPGAKRLTMYDFRHSSACYWLPRYKSESALKYRFGWTSSEMIRYYTEFLGMRDTISDDDMVVEVAKNHLEVQLNEEKQKTTIMEDRLHALEELMLEQMSKTEKADQVRKAIMLKRAKA